MLGFSISFLVCDRLHARLPILLPPLIAHRWARSQTKDAELRLLYIVGRLKIFFLVVFSYSKLSASMFFFLFFFFFFADS